MSALSRARQPAILTHSGPCWGGWGTGGLSSALLSPLILRKTASMTAVLACGLRQAQPPVLNPTRSSLSPPSHTRGSRPLRALARPQGSDVVATSGVVWNPRRPWGTRC